MRAYLFAVTLLAACGPSTREGTPDPNAPCAPGTVVDCYDGQLGTENIGPCHGGQMTCTEQGIFTACLGQVVPAAENCADGVDNNCSGEADEDVDLDGDGITTCGGDCCDSTECADPAIVNSGAFDAPGNNFDDDCNGAVDDATLVCDNGLASNSNDAMDFARAIDLCQTTTPTEKKWGVVSAKLVLADGSGTPAAKSHSIRPAFGTNVVARGGTSVALLSTGAAAGESDSNPAWEEFQNESNTNGNGTESAFPSDFVTANGGKLPNAPGCAEPRGSTALDPVMLELEIRVPTNARSFTLDTNFFSSEFPEWTCSPFNDFFVVLLDSSYAGTPANPTDKNLAFYTPQGSTMKYPVGVNLASGNTGLFTQCINGETGCANILGGVTGTISTCTGTDQLEGTGFQQLDNGSCDTNSKKGGGTGWLQTSGNVVGGEIIKVRIAIWDTSDHVLDSLAVIDHFQWSVEATDPGTVLF